eukprot:403344614
MGCINSSNITNSTREIKRHLTFNQRLVINMQQGNLKRLRELIQNVGHGHLDFTAVQGHQGILEIDEISFDTASWGPVLLSLLFNKIEIFKYFIEELKLNLGVFLVKPMTEQEYQYSLQIKRTVDPLDKKELTRFKTKLSRYNRIISIVIACKHLNTELLEYLLENQNTRRFWRRKDFYAILHFISHNLQIWQFAIPIIMRSQIAKRWFYSENEANKADVFYRLQRQFSIKILLQEMFFTLQQQLSKHPYSAPFFISLANQEFIDDKVPELSCLRTCLQNIQQFDFTMINEEINYFPELKEQIVKRFHHVTSYKEIVNQYCQKIDDYNENIYQVNQILDEISMLIMRQDIYQLENKLKDQKIENIAQVQLRVQISDHRFLNQNMLTFALLNDKAKVVEYFLENDMIDITRCCAKSTSTLNAKNFSDSLTPSFANTPNFEKSTKEWSQEIEQIHYKQTLGSTNLEHLMNSQITHTNFTDTKGFTIDSDFQSAQKSDMFKQSNFQTSKFPKKRNNTLPLEILIKNKHKELFLKFWAKFVYQFEYADFNRLILLINTEVQSEEWYRQFLEHPATKEFFQTLNLSEQLDFIDKILIAFDLQQSKTNDVQIYGLLESQKQLNDKDNSQLEYISAFNSLNESNSGNNQIQLQNLKALQNQKYTRPTSKMQPNHIRSQSNSALNNYSQLNNNQNHPNNGPPSYPIKSNLLPPNHQDPHSIQSNQNLQTLQMPFSQQNPLQNYSPYSDQIQDPFKIEQNLSTLHLLKPCTYEIIKQEPYVQIVFLNSFIKFKKDKRLLEHVKLGHSLIQYKQKLELYEEFEVKLQNVGFQIFKEQNSSQGGQSHAYTITVTPNIEFQVNQQGLDFQPELSMVKAKSVYEKPASTYGSIIPGNDSTRLDLMNMDAGSQIEKIYEKFYNHITSKEFLLPHHSNFLKMETSNL